MSGWLWALIALATVVVLLAVAALVVTHKLFSQMFLRRPKTFLSRSKDLKAHDRLGADTWRAARSWLQEQPLQTCTLRREDGVSLVARYLPPRREGGKVALAMHGYSADHRSMACIARIYAQQLGYGVLLPDARGDGDSGGEYQCQLDKNARDVAAWVEYAARELGVSVVVLHGVSMGAATVAMVSALKLRDSVRCIVEDCGFSNWEAVLAYQIKRLYHLPRWPVLPLSEWMYRRKTGSDMHDMQPARDAARSLLPFLILHGEADTFVPVYMAKEFAQAVGDRGEVLMVPQAGHARSCTVAPELYGDTLAAFLHAHVDARE